MEMVARNIMPTVAAEAHSQLMKDVASLEYDDCDDESYEEDEAEVSVEDDEEDETDDEENEKDG